MKKVLFPLVLIASIVGLASCNKDQQTSSIRLTATIEDCTDIQSPKTVLNSTALEWLAGDEIRVYGFYASNSAVFTATPQSPATTAIFSTTDPEFNDVGSYVAYYPASANVDAFHIVLPTTQVSEDGSLRNFPMHSVNLSGPNLQFHNLCGLLKINLQETGKTITSIALTTDQAINGRYEVHNVNNEGTLPSLGDVQSGTESSTTTLVCNQDISTAHDFYIYLPENEYTGLTLTITASDGTVCTKTANTTISVVRSQYTTITLSSNSLQFHPVGSKGGLFTINTDGDQVWFSQGNLQYQASTGTWHFAENQYDYVGGDNENISAAYSGWIDLFGWGTGSNPTLSTTTANPGYSTFVDWGTNAIVNGGNQSGLWRTLDVSEWNYLFNTRTDASLKYGTGNICGLGGLIILPDSWTIPEGGSFTSGFTMYGADADWSRNSYNSAQWDRMEAAGAVFLPAAGGRSYGTISGNGTRGYYWSSTHYGLGSAGCVAFASYRFWPFDYWDGAGGNSVRLVRDND